MFLHLPFVQFCVSLIRVGLLASALVFFGVISAHAGLDCVTTTVDARKLSVQMDGLIQVGVPPKTLANRAVLTVCPHLFGGLLNEFEAEVGGSNLAFNVRAVSRAYLLSVKNTPTPAGPVHVNMRLPSDTQKPHPPVVWVYLYRRLKPTDQVKTFELLGRVDINSDGIFQFRIPPDRLEQIMPKGGSRKMPSYEASILLADFNPRPSVRR